MDNFTARIFSFFLIVVVSS